MNTFGLHKDKKQGCRGSFIVDASQDPGQRPRCGAWFPAFSRTSAIYSLSSSDIFTGSELDFAMGFPSLDLEACRQYKSCFPSLDGLSWNERLSLRGNGIHCGAVFAWTLWVFSHLAWREDIESFMPPMGFPESVRFLIVD